MEFSKVFSIDNAIDIVSENFSNYKAKTIIVDLDSSLDKITAKDYFSSENLPAFNRSTVDGYAVKTADIQGASFEEPVVLTVVDTVIMGKLCERVLGHMEAVYVPTGGMVPLGADAVIMIEDTVDGGENTVKINTFAKENTNIIFVGDDLKIGETIITKGKKITPFDIGMLAVAGVAKVEVFAPLSFSIISTGDEIIEIDRKQEMGQIRDINSHILENMLKKSGCVVTEKTIVGDDFHKIKAAVAKSLEFCDAVIISGGSSVGKKDYTYDVISSFDDAKVLVHGINMKPGKPTIIGKIDDKPVFGLPGHPVSAVIVYKMIIERFLQCAYGHVEENYVAAKLTADIRPYPGKLTYQVVRLHYEDKAILAEPVNGKSGLISLLSKAHGFVKIPLDASLIKKDETVKVTIL